MAFGDKIKRNLLESSDMYNFYKDEYESSNKKIDELDKKYSKKLKELDKKYNNRLRNQRRIIDSYNSLFNTILLDYELTPKPLLKSSFALNQELLDFVDNVCSKHGLEYWIDYGNLLGAVRHGGFIPWDDDMDIGMMRKDYNEFLNVFEDELKEHGLEDDIFFNVKRYYNGVRTHIDIFAKIIYNPGDDIGKTMIYHSDKVMFAGLDIFPYDFLTEKTDDIEDRFQNIKPELYTDIYNGKDYDFIIEKYYDALNLSFDKQKHFIPGFEGTWGGSMYDFEIIDSDKVFPLASISFEGKDYPCPNDFRYYLQAIYGDDYLEIPPVVRHHGRQKGLRKIEDVEVRYEDYINKLKDANDNF